MTLFLSGKFSFFIFFESKHVENLISKQPTRAYKYHAISLSIDDLCALNGDGEFSKSFKCIYTGELELKLEYSGTHAPFLDLDIRIEDGIFVYKLFDKRDKFPFFIIRMPHFEINISSTLFYDSIFSEFLRMTRCTLKLEYFLSRVSDLYSRILSLGANQSCIIKQILKGFQRYPDILKKYGKNYNELLQELKSYLSLKQPRSN